MPFCFTKVSLEEVKDFDICSFRSFKLKALLLTYYNPFEFGYSL